MDETSIETLQKIENMQAEASNYLLIQTLLEFIIVFAIIGIAIWAVDKYFKNEKEKRIIEQKKLVNRSKIDTKL